MNIIKFFKELATKWNTESKCTSCWTYGSPFSAPTQPSPACNHLFVTDYEVIPGYIKNDQTQQINRHWSDHHFTLYVVKPSNAGFNVYHEQEDHPIDESLWQNTLEPLLNCLGNGNEFELCEMGYDFDILTWNMKAIIYKENANYAGWKITGAFRQYAQ